MTQELFPLKENSAFRLLRLIFIPVAVVFFALGIVSLSMGVAALVLFMVLGIGFAVIPFIFAFIIKKYSVTLDRDCVVCVGDKSSAFNQREIPYSSVEYLLCGNGRPEIYNRGDSPIKLVSDYGKFTNVYDRNRQILFSYRNDDAFEAALMHKCPNAIQISNWDELKKRRY